MSMWRILFSMTALATLLATNPNLEARTMKIDFSREKIILGLGGGYAPVLDTFSSLVPHGGHAFLNASFSLAPVTGNRWSPIVEVFIDSVFTYTHSPFSADITSYISFFSVKAGPWYLFHIHRLFSPFFGFYADFTVAFMHLEIFKRDEMIFRPGFTASFGFLMNFTDLFGLKVSGEYSAFPMSGTALANMTVNLGLTFTLSAKNQANKNADDPREKAEAYYTKAVANFYENRISQAEELFNETNRLITGYRDTRTFLEKIRVINEVFATARQDYSRGQYFQAVPLLRRSLPYYPESGRLLAASLEKIKNSIAQWEKEAVTAYEENNLRLAITLFERIQTLVPDNKTAELYLPRARQKLKAMDKMRGGE